MKRFLNILVLVLGAELGFSQVQLSGYVQSGVNSTFTEKKNTFSFQAKRLRLLADAKVSPKVDFRLQAEAFNGVSGTTNARGAKNIVIMDAYATYGFSPEFKLRVGQFYTPMGFENYDISPATLETVDFSNIVYRIACRNPYEYNFIDYGRDLGFMLMGDLLQSEEGFSYIHYDLAYTNGAFPNKDDSNNAKDVYVSLGLRPLKDLYFKATYNYGEYTDNNQPVAPITNAPMSRFVVGGWYHHKEGWNVRGEYGFLQSHSHAATQFDEKSAYLLVGYHIAKFQPVVRWDMYANEVNKNDITTNYNRILWGLEYTPVRNVKVDLNFVRSFYTHAKGAAQLQLMGLFRF